MKVKIKRSSANFSCEVGCGRWSFHCYHVAAVFIYED